MEVRSIWIHTNRARVSSLSTYDVMRRGEAFSQPYISSSPAHKALRTFDAEF
jgi:hypothetical protein